MDGGSVGVLDFRHCQFFRCEVCKMVYNRLARDLYALPALLLVAFLGLALVVSELLMWWTL